MAHFAKLNTNNVVTEVVVIANEDCQDADGNESEAVGITFCQSLFGSNTTWKQTSYNANIRKNYAGINYTYDSTRDAYIPPQPYNSWVLDETTCLWEAPIDKPADDGTADANGNMITYNWDEDTVSWVQVIKEAP